MAKLKKFDPQNKKKDQSHKENREYNGHKQPRPQEKEKSGANRQRFINMIENDEI